MSKSSKVGVVLASAVGVAFLAMTGCASQGSGAATPANLPDNCKVYTENTCKNASSCKQRSDCKQHHKKRHYYNNTSSNPVKTDAAVN